MADAGADVQPATFVTHHPEEIHRHDVADGHDDHEQTARGDTQAAVQNPEVGADDGEGDQDFEHEEGALGERVEDGDEAVDGVERKGGDGGDVSGGEKCGLEEEEEEESGAEVGEGEGAVGGLLAGRSLCRGSELGRNSGKHA